MSTSVKEKETFLVLVADDSEDDRFLLKDAIRHARSLKVVNEVANGRDAIAYLHGDARFGDRDKFPLPDLLLLDLQMPFKTGFDVLEWLRTQAFESMTVVVLTDSMSPDNIKRALDLGADLFQIKPVAKRDREAMVHALEEYLRKPARVHPHQPAFQAAPGAF